MTSATVNLCIISTPGDIFSLCFLDVAIYMKHELKKAGIITRSDISKNRLFHDNVNIIFGAHMNPDSEIYRNYPCIFVNLEQLGSEGKRLSEDYIRLLRDSFVIDYDPDNIQLISPGEGRSCVISMGYADYLKRHIQYIPLEERPIDLLFYGAMNDARVRILNYISGLGAKVTVIDKIFGPEKDIIVASSKLVVNISYFEKCSFEQVRVFQCLSIGTPVVSILNEKVHNVPPAYRDSVFFVEPDGLSDFFGTFFKTDSFYRQSTTIINNFQSTAQLSGIESMMVLIDKCLLSHGSSGVTSKVARIFPRLNVGSGKKYMPGWLNVDINPSTIPDLIINLSEKDMQLPREIMSETLGPILLCDNSVQIINLDNVLEHIADLTDFMQNCLRLLVNKGRIIITVPYHTSNTAWQDPTHVRAMNENSWIYYADWFWYLGWFEHRFSIVSLQFLDAQEKLTESTSGRHFMRVVMEKVETTLAERNIARLQRADFGPVP